MENCIIYHNYNKITGSLIDCIEYYLAILEYNPNIIFYLVNIFREDIGSGISLDKIYSLINERYINLPNNWKNNIKFIYKHHLVKKEFNKVLFIDYYTPKEIYGYFKANEVHFITEKIDSIYTQWSRKHYNVTYWTEIPLFYTDNKYKMKFLFHKFKHIQNSENKIYIYSPEIKEPLKEPKIKKYIDSIDKPYFFKTDKGTSNLFEKFNEYTYIHLGKIWDTHPRLFFECKHYNKKVNYLNDINYIDGSWYRYNDYLMNNIDERSFENDEIVEIFKDEELYNIS